MRTFDRSQIRPGSFGYTTTLSGTYTGGYFNYTDADKDIDIECSVGGGSHTKSVNRRATSVYDASVQLCAELNNANHGTANKPQVLLIAEGQIGVAAQTLTMTAAADTWETLGFAAFTPTAAGVVTIRVVSRSAKPFGSAYFDSVVVT